MAVDTAHSKFPCEQCGAWLHFDPDQSQLACPYCGTAATQQRIPRAVREQDFEAWLKKGGAERVRTREEKVLRCAPCGASTTTTDEVIATECAFCGHPLFAPPQDTRVIPPIGVLPFAVTKDEAREHLRKWLKSLWFAPSALAQRALRDDPLQGIYTPYWTYDAHTLSEYRGQRGDAYWVTQTRWVTVNGKRTRQSHRVRKIRWTSVRGRVSRDFDDVLVLATDSLPAEFVSDIAPWDLNPLVAFSSDFLAGYRAETYRVNLPDGFERAKTLMRPGIESSVRSAIGGDEQRIHSLDSHYREVRFKHVLIPIWISTYRYHERSFTFLVNGRSGRVRGQRPYSVVKIVFAVLLGVLALAGIAFLIWSTQRR